MEKIQISVIIPVYNAEDRLRILLDCVKQQTLTDFEVILVNDGSTDRSQEIIEEYCKEDSRFHGYAQENQGAAMARNTGLEHAKGEYVTFYDADDLVPEDALEKMYECATDNNADLVVGARTNAYLMREVVNKQSLRFTEKKEIDRFDADFLSSFGVWNKLFRKQLIDEHKIRFEKHKDVEDGIFVFLFLRVCQTIAGCESSVYSYRKRPFFEGTSSSKQISYVDLEGSCDSLMRLREIYEETFEEAGIPADDVRRETFNSAFYFRIANVTFLNKYYRHLWNIEQKAFDLACKTFYECREKMSTEDFEELCRRQIDLDITKNLKTQKEIVKHPSLAIVFSWKPGQEDLNYAMKSLYDQIYPDFVVYVPVQVYRHLESEYRKKKNLIMYMGNAEKELRNVIEKKKAEFLLYVDEPVFFDEVSIRRAIAELKRNPEVAMTVAEPVRLNIGKNVCKRIREMKSLFRKSLNNEEYLAAEEKRFDTFHVNKFVRIAALQDETNRKAFLNIDWDAIPQCLSPVRASSDWVFVKPGSTELRKRAAEHSRTDHGIDFSVIYYSYKEGAEQSASLQSILNQTIGTDHIQLIAAGDEPALSDKETESFKRYRLVSQKEGESMPALLNRCMDKAIGTYLVFLSEGDVWNPDAFAKAKAFMEKHVDDADVFVCRTDRSGQKSGYTQRSWIETEESRILNLTKEFEKVNPVAENSIYRNKNIGLLRFNQNLTVGYLQAFYERAVMEQLSIGFIKDSVFCPGESTFPAERKQLAKDSASLCNYLKNKELALIEKSEKQYKKTWLFVQNELAEDFLLGFPEETTILQDEYREEEYDDTLQTVVGHIKKRTLKALKTKNPGLGEYFFYLNQYSGARKEGYEKSFLTFVEEKGFAILLARMIEENIHLEGRFLISHPYEEEQIALVAKDEANELYKATIQKSGDRTLIDHKGVILAESFHYSLDLPSSVGKQFSFVLEKAGEQKEVVPSFGICTRLKEQEEARLRDSETIIRKTKTGFCVDDPSEEMKQILEKEKQDRHLDNVIAFVSTRGDKPEDNLRLVMEALSDLPSVSFTAKQPYSEEQMADFKDKLFHSKVVVTDDYLFPLREQEKTEGQKLVQLWHACGAFKKFGKDGTTLFPGIDSLTHQYYDVVTVSAEGISDIYAGAFAIPNEKVLPLGIPRTDLYLNNEYIQNVQEAVYQTYPQLKEKRILLYAPTFRVHAGQTRDTFVPELDFEELSKQLAEDQVFVIGPHPAMTEPILHDEYPNILEIRDISTNDLMMAADLLITDYSSVIFEFALLKKPIVFFCYDYDSYDRDFYLDYETELPGEILRDQEELFVFLQNTDYSIQAEYDRFLETYMGACDGHSTERVTERIREIFQS